MSDTDEIRSVLAEAVALPGQVHPQPGAAAAIRARARRRHRTTLVTSVVAVAVVLPACLGLVALLVGTVGSDSRSASVPASEVTVDPGPRMLGTPVELRPVLEEYGSCPVGVDTVVAADGPGCYRLGRADMVIRRVKDLEARPALGPDGTVTDDTDLLLTMTDQDTATFSSLTARSVDQRLAMVISDAVQAAPTIAERITGGVIQIRLDRGEVRAVLADLTG